METAKSTSVAAEMKKLIAWYNSLKKVSFENIVEFDCRFGQDQYKILLGYFDIKY